MADPVPQPQDYNNDLGFGAVVARESRQRLLNADGTFNVRREGLPFWQSVSLYDYMLSLTWPRFLSYVAILYIFTNAVFAVIYVACGAHAVTGFETEPVQLRLLTAFFFSVHTLATIGYGSIAPANITANVVVTVESLVGLLGFALVAGIVYARFARPRADIRFSEHAIIAPYRNITALMFRIANQRANELVDLQAKVILSRRKKNMSSADRDFTQLELERSDVIFFPLTWTVVHPINDKSPLKGLTHQDLVTHEAEFLVLLNGFDETFSQTVHTRSSYVAEDVIWGAKFKSVFTSTDDGKVAVDVRKLDEIDRVALD
jgi:inward rectifier potassium channel